MDGKTPSAYCSLVYKTLKYWLDLHTKAETWADEWAMDDVKYAFESSKGEIKNDYFSFDWKAAAIKRLAIKYRGSFLFCRDCGVVESGWHDCERRTRVATRAEIADWLSEIGEASIPEDVLRESLVKDGFKVYRHALKPITEGIETEIKDVLRDMRRAQSNEDLLQSVMWGTRVFHVHGSVVGDYADRVPSDFEYNVIDSIRNNGLESVFSSDDIKEFLDADLIDLKGVSQNDR